MKKIDKLILGSFIGPFILTFLVVVFILLTQHMLKYFDDIIGKGLDAVVIGQLLFYFAVFMTPVAMPLAVLLSSLITFGNLGEHFELTAIKSSGISLLRALLPIFIFVLFLTGIAFYANNNLVPKAALEAYSLLYDIKQKKPALDLREGAFYNGIPNISIKVNEKDAETGLLKDVIIYDHRKNDGNKEVTSADSGRMYTILNEQYLKLELYNGFIYSEGNAAQQDLIGTKAPVTAGRQETLSRSKFDKTQIVFDLSSFQLERTDKKWFQGNRIMRNLSQLNGDIDSLDNEIQTQRLNYYLTAKNYFTYYAQTEGEQLPPDLKVFKVARDSIVKERNEQRDSAALPPARIRKGKPAPVDVAAARDSMVSRPPVATKTSTQQPAPKKITKASADSASLEKLDSVFEKVPTRDVAQTATNMARQVKSQIQGSNMGRNNYESDLIVFKIQWHLILANSLACVAMFLIGAPLGSIIKRGGLGVPFLVSILFFIIFYVLSMQGQKLAKQGTVSPEVGVWMSDAVLFLIGLMFLRQARIDARLFESDFYAVVVEKIRRWFNDHPLRKPKFAKTTN
ncbi:MAG: YjgP/YjgQ family permease [Bacteroidia bacterium]|nr:YjgP/YjgQ family permease [Bacteroidia bacterium]